MDFSRILCRLVCLYCLETFVKMTPQDHDISHGGSDSAPEKRLRGRQSDPQVKSNKETNTSDEVSLYADHRKIHPKYMPGFFRHLKNWANLGFMLIYFLTPWVRWDRGPGCRIRQSLLLISGA